MQDYSTPNDEAGKPAAGAKDEQERAFWEATASDALREVWDTPENEAWDMLYQQEQTRRSVQAS